jgi:HEAT repeat associated with sister chromatid cohesion
MLPILAFQLPEEEACPVVAEMLRVMATDSCSSVREAALESICINKLTLPAIISRLRDVTASVRAQARMKVMRVMEAGNVSEQDLDNSESLDASNGNTTMTD